MEPQSMESSHLGGRRRELVLDTPGTCFLCLEESETGVASTANTGLRDVCLRNISRYLKINPSQVLLKALNFNDIVVAAPTQGEYGSCDFSVLLCPHCAALTEELSHFIRQMELMELLIGQHLRTFQQTLTLTEQDQTVATSHQKNRWEHLLERWGGPGGKSPFEILLLKQVRREAGEKCSAKVALLERTTGPKVCLQRLEDAKSSVKAVKRILLTDSILKAVPSSLGDHYPEVKHTDGGMPFKAMAVKKQQVGIGPNLEMRFVQKEAMKYCQKAEEPGFWRCTLCEKILKLPSVMPHLTNHHPQAVFSECKLAHVTDSAFKKMCTDILKRETIVCNMAQKNPTSKLNRTLKCVHCGRSLFGGFHLRTHLTLCQYPILQEKLVKCQNETCHNHKLVPNPRSVWTCRRNEEGPGCGNAFVKHCQFKASLD